MKFFTSNFCVFSLLVCQLSALPWPSSSAARAAQPQPSVRTSGRLINLKGEGVANIPVYLWEEKGSLSLAAKTGADGKFDFEHPVCGALTLEVLPPIKTSYASAVVDEVPGDQNHKLLVEMHLGHLVSGRVAHDGKGIKGVVVRIRPIELDKHGSQIDYSSLEKAVRIHGGGTTTTAKDGAFTLVITPGVKQLTVINNRYPKLEKKVQHSLTVRENLNVGVLHL